MKQKKNIIQQISANFDGEVFAKSIHLCYKNLGGIKAHHVGKGIAKYVVEEMGTDWYTTVVFLNRLLEKHNAKEYQCAKNNINWQKVCERHCKKMLVKTKTQTAFKYLFYLVAENNSWNADALLAEHILNAYGWDKIIRIIVHLYEELYVRATLVEVGMDTRIVEEVIEGAVKTIPAAEEEVVDISTKTVEAEATKEAIATELMDADSKTGISKSTISPPTTNPKRYKRGRKVKVTYKDDGSSKIYNSAALAEKATRICHGSANKCLNGYYSTLTDKVTGRKCSLTYYDAA